MTVYRLKLRRIYWELEQRGGRAALKTTQQTRNRLDVTGMKTAK